MTSERLDSVAEVDRLSSDMHAIQEGWNEVGEADKGGLHVIAD